MDKNEFKRNFIAGVFFILGVVLIFFVILTIGANKGVIQPKFHVKVLFKNVGGLIEGAPVLLSGVNVGNVGEISFLDKQIKGRRVVVKLNIFEEYKRQLQNNVHFAIKTEGVLGGKLVEISILDNGSPINLNEYIIGEDPLDVHDLALIYARAAESLTSTSEDLSKIDIQELSQALGEAAQSLSKTSLGINTILEELQYISRKSKRLMNRIEKRIIDGNLFKVF